MPQKSASGGSFKASQELCSQFTAITGADRGLAGRLLGLAKGNLDQAVNMFLDSPRAKWKTEDHGQEVKELAGKKARQGEVVLLGSGRDHKRLKAIPNDGIGININTKIRELGPKVEDENWEEVSAMDTRDAVEGVTIDLTQSGDELKDLATPPSTPAHEHQPRTEPPTRKRDEPALSVDALLDEMGELTCGCTKRVAHAPGDCGWFHSLPSALEPVGNLHRQQICFAGDCL
jgi:hypothetical protein